MKDQDLFIAIGSFIGSKRRTKDYHTALREWCKFLGGEPWEVEEQFKAASRVEASRFKEHISNLPGKDFDGIKRQAATKASGATVAKKLYILRRIYHELMGDGILDHNPFATIQIPNAEYNRKQHTRAIPADKARRILQICDDKTQRGIRDRAIFSVMFGAGLRRGEVVSLQLSDFQESECGTPYLLLRDTKAQKTARQALPGWVATNLSLWIKEREKQGAKRSSRMFVSLRNHGEDHRDKIDVSSIRRLVKRYCEAVGLDPSLYSAHSCRATYGSRMDERKVPIQDIQRALRHASPNTTQKYLRSRDEVEDSVGRNFEL